MPSSRRRNDPNAHAGPSTYQPRRIEDIPDDEKGEEELELEEVLFGRKRKRVASAQDEAGSVVEEEGEDAPAFFYDEMGNVDMADGEAEDSDKQVRRSYFSKDCSHVPFQLFFVDSLLRNQQSGDASSSESESEAEDGTRRQPKKSHYNRLGQSDEESQSSSDEGSDEESEESEEEGSASSRSSVQNPFAAGAGKAKKQALWHDPADDQIRVDLAADNRLRKLANGKTGKDAVVGGKGLETKLREQ